MCTQKSVAILVVLSISRRSYSVDTKDVNLEILHFKQFYKHFVFEKDEEGYVKTGRQFYCGGCFNVD
ncbi:hypothetical protein CYJ66_02510 [Gardnerella vaginalis]|nr:hypothetical protein EGX90_05110 [Gardnerella vaginalis]PKZ53656.1 hypothetical protein CYJ66_02510 [Gardnerella vaginalis]PKZ55766.1 hypothetical protein CYJ64_02510 [Gardnerella vaginalis]PNL26036.1 hypothetical protein CEP75_005090 [Gardnerella vaginalis]PTE03178.1 hypothetical protein C6Y65_07275 [Gardnerella vaginalis]